MEMDQETLGLAIGFAAVLGTLVGVGKTLMKLGRDVQKSNEAAHERTEKHIRALEAKNETGHAGTVTQVDGLRTQLGAVARDVAFLAGRQKERDQGNGDRS